MDSRRPKLMTGPGLRFGMRHPGLTNPRPRSARTRRAAFTPCERPEFIKRCSHECEHGRLGATLRSVRNADQGFHRALPRQPSHREARQSENAQRRALLKTLPSLALLTACTKSTKLKLALNWKPEPEFGGFYAAPYSKYGLAVDILPGGSGTPTVQMVGAGSVDFGIVSADEIILARSHGNDVVALFAVFQDSPTGIMAHASRNLKEYRRRPKGRHPGNRKRTALRPPHEAQVRIRSRENRPLARR